jgi:hypothetical protein
LIKSQVDFYTGLLFTAIGLFFAVAGLNLDYGTPANMGPGFLPLTFSVILIVIGLLQIVRGCRVSGKKVQFHFRDPFIIVALLVGFGYSLETVGAIPSVFVLMLASAYLHKNFTWRHFIISFLAIMVMLLAFKYLLGSTIPLLWK